MTSETQNLVLVAMLAAIALYVVFFFWHMVRRPRKPVRKNAPVGAIRLDPQKHTVVDGSNVMHWGGEPSILVLIRVLEALVQKGLIPIVYFDANVGYKLWGHYANAGEMARRTMLKTNQVIIAPNGVTADQILLELAVENQLRVVTNDRFLDWRVQFPQVGEKGFLIKGTWQQGSVIFRNL